MVWVLLVGGLLLTNVLVLTFFRACAQFERGLDTADRMDPVSARWWLEIDRLERISR